MFTQKEAWSGEQKDTLKVCKKTGFDVNEKL